MLKKLEIFFRKLSLRLLLLLTKKVKNQNPNINKGDRVLLIRLNRIGDALVTTPLIKTLNNYSSLIITVLASPSNSFVFENNPLINEVVVLAPGLKGFIRTVKKINKKNFKVIIDTHSDVSTTVSFLIAFLKAPNKIGFKKGTEKLYSRTIEQKDKSKFHIIERVLQLAEVFRIKFELEEVNVDYFPNEKSIELANRRIKGINPENKFLLGINISAGSDARFWGVVNFKKLLEKLSVFPISIIILCSPGDSKRAYNIAQNKFNVFYSNSFDEFAAIIKNLDLLFTPDTSVVHLASAFEVPMFGIYVKYKTTEMEWYPYRSEYEIVITHKPNFNNLDFNLVTDKFMKFLTRHLKNEKNTRL